MLLRRLLLHGEWLEDAITLDSDVDGTELEDEAREIVEQED